MATAFCPDVGIVTIEAAADAHLGGPVLRSYGPPVQIGPGGVHRVP